MTRRGLFAEYLAEINDWESGADKDASLEMPEHNNCFWKDIYADNGKEPVGFFVVSEREGNNDISAAYVQPAYRCRGLMSDAVQDFVSEHPAEYSVNIPEDDEWLWRFWYFLFRRLNFHLLDSPNTDTASRSESGTIHMIFHTKTAPGIC